MRPILLLAALLAACSASAPPDARRSGNQCLYGVEAEYGRSTQWGSCTHPPPYSVRISGPN